MSCSLLGPQEALWPLPWVGSGSGWGVGQKTNGVTFLRHDAAVRKCPDEWVTADHTHTHKFFLVELANSIERPKFFFQRRGAEETQSLYSYINKYT